MAKLDRRGAGSQGISWRKDPTLEAGIALIEPDAHMNCAAFEHPCLFSAEGFAQLYRYVGKALGVLRKKS